MRKRRRLKRKPIFIILIVVLIVVFSFKFDFIKKKVDNKNIDKIEQQVVEEVKDVKRSMSLVMVGDALIHDSIYNDAFIGNNNYDFKGMFTDIEPLIKDYDLRYYNQETIIGVRI